MVCKLVKICVFILYLDILSVAIVVPHIFLMMNIKEEPKRRVVSFADFKSEIKFDEKLPVVRSMYDLHVEPQT